MDMTGSNSGTIKYYTVVLVSFFWHCLYLNMCGCSIPLVIVGNKTDLHRERVVSTEDGKRLADTWKASFYEVSARSHEVSFQFVLSAAFHFAFRSKL